MEQLVGKERRRPRWIIMGFGIAFILGGTLQRFPLSLGGASIYVPHLLSIALFPVIFYRDKVTAAIRAAVLTFMLIVAVVALPSLALPWLEVRLSFILQILLNSFTLIIAFVVFRQLPKADLRRLVLLSSVGLVAAAVVQLGLNPDLNARTETTFGLSHPILFFSEETWLAVFASLLSVAAYGIGSRQVGLIVTMLVFFIGTRSAMIICACSFLMTYQFASQNKWIRLICIAGPIGFSVWFLADAVFATSERVYNDTLDTRSSDISAVRQANNDSFFPFGGEVLSVFDFSRSRQVPATSNVQGFELLWKFGMGGLIVLVVFSLLVGHTLPKLAMSRQLRVVWPVWIPMMIWPAMLQFNNAFGYPWMWVLIALCLAVISHGEPTEETFPTSNVSKKRFGATAWPMAA